MESDWEQKRIDVKTKPNPLVPSVSQHFLQFIQALTGIPTPTPTAVFSAFSFRGLVLRLRLRNPWSFTSSLHCQQLCQYLSDMQDTRISKDVLHKLNQLVPMWGCSVMFPMVPSCGELGRQDGRRAESQVQCLPVYPVCPVPVISGRVESRPASATTAGALPASGSAASAFLRFEISARGFLSVKQC